MPPGENLRTMLTCTVITTGVALKCADRLQAEQRTSYGATAYFPRVSNQAGVHMTKRTASVCLLAGPAGLCVHASIMNALLRDSYTGLAHGPLDRLRACLGAWHEMSCAMTSILALPRSGPLYRGVRERHLYRGSYWCASVVCLGVHLSRCPRRRSGTFSSITMGPGLVIMIASILAAFAFTTYANIVGALSSTPIAAANFAEPLLTAMLLLNGIMITRHKIKSLFYPFYLINPQSWLCYIIVEAVTHGHPRGDHVMDYFQYKKGQIGASFCALLAIDAGAILLGWAVLTHAFAAEVDGSELSVVEKVATCGVADDAEDDDDFVRKPPREEDGEVCLPVGIC